MRDNGNKIKVPGLGLKETMVLPKVISSTFLSGNCDISLAGRGSWNIGKDVLSEHFKK